METGLRNKVVLITGAASGIGAATARAFAAEGAHLALLDINQRSLYELAGDLRNGSTVVSLAVADLSTREGAERGIEEALLAHSDRIDVLVNNVGVCVPRSFDQTTDDDWLHTWNLNFMSYQRVSTKVLPRMRAQGRGCIINNASDLARQPESLFPDYAAAKAAVLSLTRCLALEEGPNIRVNAVAPGPIETPLWTRPGGLADRLALVHNRPPEEAVTHELRLRRLPLGRLGRSEEVANVMVFLASNLASFVTGSVWGVDGGSIRSLF
jgi:NAD(P)-dependent dehydrogenase (short-subunit alcohol dehydrogenase family)